MSYFRMGDPLDDFTRLDREQEKRLERLPKCDQCGEPIQGEHCYKIHGETLCEECMNDRYREDVEVDEEY